MAELDRGMPVLWHGSPRSSGQLLEALVQQVRVPMKLVRRVDQIARGEVFLA